MRGLIGLFGLAFTAPAASADQLHFELVAGGLDRVTAIASAPALPQSVLIAEQPGRVRLIEQGNLRSLPVLDITDRVRSIDYEQGLTGLALPPAFPARPYLYLHYIRADMASVVARFSLLPGPVLAADPASERVLLTVAQPAPIHNCNHLVFGPDSFLYIGCGDGGPGSYPVNNPQALSQWYGKILRVDVNNVPPHLPYAIPADNPYVGVPGAAPEIWLRGLRNPWKFSFDPLTGDLWIGDVGQSTQEEVDFVPAGTTGGANFGWNTVEGMNCFPPSQPTCDLTGLTPPLFTYTHSNGRCAVTGGVRLRGVSLPGLSDAYVYADYCSGELIAAHATEANWISTVTAELDAPITVVAQTAASELWIGTYGIGDAAVYRVAANDTIFVDGYDGE